MPKFDLKKITAIKGKQVFYQLTIDDKPDYTDAKTDEEKNDRKTGVLDIYETELEKKYEKPLRSIYGLMQRVANNQSVNGTQYHPVQDRPKNDPVKEFEFKSGDLRVYAFKIDGGKIFAFGGYKNTQKEDIKRMRALKNQYLESLK